MSESGVCPAPLAGSAPPDTHSDGLASSSAKSLQYVQRAPTLTSSYSSSSLSKQKRKRTSAHDQLILESEYQRNPRPDKAERLEIVAKVGLDNKEVQIWFQNRRQSSRRKSRPLESEDAPSQAIPTSQEVLDEPLQSASAEQGSSQVPAESTHTEESPSISSQTDPPLEASTQVIEPQAAAPLPKQEDLDDAFQSSQVSSVVSDTAVQVEAVKPTISVLAREASTSEGKYLADRRNAPTRAAAAEGHTRSVSDPRHLTGASRGLTRSNSYLRISLTDDGHAQVIDRAVKSPSPRRHGDATAAGAGLRRSYSAAGFSESLRPSISEMLGKKIPRTTAIGRSRDSRAWEFWCDSDARSSLVDKADQEVTGSAADAIGQIVANKKALRAQGARRHLQPGLNRSLSSNSRVNRPPLSRSRTSNARLQTLNVATTSGPHERSEKKKLRNGGEEEEEEEAYDVVTESDKENWTPDSHCEQYFERRPSHMSHMQSAQEATDSDGSVTKPSRPSTAHSRHSKNQSLSLVRTADAEDEEIAQFMRGGPKVVASNASSTSSGEELDCVQSLLSLSQGNWR